MVLFRNISFSKEVVHSVISQQPFLETFLSKILTDLKAGGGGKKRILIVMYYEMDVYTSYSATNVFLEYGEKI